MAIRSRLVEKGMSRMTPWFVAFETVVVGVWNVVTDTEIE